MSEHEAAIPTAGTNENGKFSPGENLEALYAAYHAADEATKKAKSAYEASDLEKRRRLLPACLKLLAEHEAATFGQTMAIYERARLVPSAGAEHLGLARVYRLFDAKALEAMAKEGTLLSANQGAAIAKAFEFRKQFALDSEKFNRHIADLASNYARLGTGPREISMQLDAYVEELERKFIEIPDDEDGREGTGTDAQVGKPGPATGKETNTKVRRKADNGPEPDPNIPNGSKVDPKPVDRPHQCPRYVVVGKTYGEIKATLVRMMQDPKRLEMLCKNGIALVAEAPKPETKTASSISGRASATSSLKETPNNLDKFNPVFPTEPSRMEA